MKVSIEGSPKEIAALAAELQERSGSVFRLSTSMSDEELQKLLNRSGFQKVHQLTEDDLPGPFVGGGIFHGPYPRKSAEESGTPTGENPKQPQTNT